MSARAELPDLMAEGGHCSVCGSAEWAGMWRGESEIRVCRSCATEVLPRLIADAVWHPWMRTDTPANAFETIRSEYWRAIALCGIRGREIISQKPAWLSPMSS